MPENRHDPNDSHTPRPHAFAEIVNTNTRTPPRDPSVHAASVCDHAGTWLLSDAPSRAIDVSVILGSVDRPDLVRRCIEAVRASIAGSDLSHEIIVAIGRDNDPAAAWLRAQGDVHVINGGMMGAIDAFNRAYAVSRGLLVCQINDDVLVEGKSIAIAARHLRAHPNAAAVVFQFRRTGESDYRNERYATPGSPLHPNQIVARRATCEAVVAKIGAFWGDEEHRTDKTYGGDSAFGAVCHHLGLRLDLVEGVTCFDILQDDALRAINRRTAEDHGERWRVMYHPLITSRGALRPVGATPARLAALDPTEGRFPPQRQPRRERVLHIHLSTPDDPQAGLVRALRNLGDYAQVDWPLRNKNVAGAIFEAANWLRPTLVFMQLQTPDVIDPALVERLRPLLAPDGVIATWCGDVAGQNSPWVVDWQVPLGRAVDLTLHSSFTHVKALRAAGVVNAAYLQIGYDEEQYCQPPAGTTRHQDVCFLGNRYYSAEYLQTMQRSDAGLRDEVIAKMAAAMGSRFALHGSGHGTLGAVPLRDAHLAYQKSKIGLNVSLCNFFDAYSSDRIFRVLGCGAMLLTKWFPLLSTYGLINGVNCRVWNAPDEAIAIAAEMLADPVRLDAIVSEGATLAREHHTWSVRTRELASYLTLLRED